jgi:hypothetical protein
MQTMADDLDAAQTAPGAGFSRLVHNRAAIVRENETVRSRTNTTFSVVAPNSKPSASCHTQWCTRLFTSFTLAFHLNRVKNVKKTSASRTNQENQIPQQVLCLPRCQELPQNHRTHG